MSLLPAGYKRLLYIESTGSQYVDTNINAASGLEMYADFEFSDISDNYSIAGANSNGTRIFLAQNINGVWGYGYGSYYGGSTGAVVGEKYRIHSKLFPGSQTLEINGATVASGTVANSYDTGLNLYLLGMNLNGASFGAIKGKLYSCQIYNNGTLVRDYVPAKLPDGSIGLIDKLTDEFYPNMGTGTFIAGPVAKEEIPPRKVTVDLIPPMTGEKTDDFTIEYSVVDDAGTDAFEVVEYIDGVKQRSLSVAANEKVSTIVESTGMVDGLHTFMIIVDGTVEVEYSFHVNNTTAKVEATELSINMPTTVNVNEKFLISVIITELSFTIAKLKIHAGDVYSGEV